MHQTNKFNSIVSQSSTTVSHREGENDCVLFEKMTGLLDRYQKCWTRLHFSHRAWSSDTRLNLTGCQHWRSDHLTATKKVQPQQSSIQPSKAQPTSNQSEPAHAGEVIEGHTCNLEGRKMQVPKNCGKKASELLAFLTRLRKAFWGAESYTIGVLTAEV